MLSGTEHFSQYLVNANEFSVQLMYTLRPVL